MSWGNELITYEDNILQFLEAQSFAENEASWPGLKIMDSAPARVVMRAYVRGFQAVRSLSGLSPVEQQRLLDEHFVSALSGNELMCAHILMSNDWQE
jgi:hypothetical protein